MEICVSGDEKRIKHYNSSHKILLVGEGDFSFAKCLAKAFGSAGNMVATSLDSQARLLEFYRTSALTNINELKDLGCTILHGVDAGTMKHHPKLNGNLFDRIVFNFPHAGFTFPEHNDFQIELHKNVVRGFLSSARDMLTGTGEVHVTHKTAHPFNKWEIEKLGDEVGLRLVEEASFWSSDYPGYQNKRGNGIRPDQSFPVGEASTFKFSL